MNEPQDPNPTVDISSAPPDSLDAGLAAGFATPVEGSSSVLAKLQRSLGPLHPVLLREAEGESDHVVKPKSDAMPAPAETGDRYQLSGEIARGGMGAVLRGRDIDLGRDLAVKVLLEKYVNRPDVARRFIEEAQIGGQLQHPGVVPVYDIGHFGDRPFFTMKLVKGKTLAALLNERGDPAADRARLLNIALQVCQTLAYAHAKGVVHRDLKPGNVMVGAFGEVQVMDWGLAKVLAEGGIADEEQASRLHNQQPEDVTTIRTARSTGSAGGQRTDTETGSLLGTPAYIPPEQANGDIAHLDRRADVFGLGAILCEVLTGKPPYVGRSAEEVRRKAANADLADALARLAGCGAEAELATLTSACLSPEASDRPKDARAVADALAVYLNGVQDRVKAAERDRAVAVARAIEERRRRKVQLALAASILALTTLGGLSTAYYLQQRQAREAAVDRVVGRAITLRDQALAKPEDLARWQVALAAVEQAEAGGEAMTHDRLLTLQTEIREGLDAAQRDQTLLDRLIDIRSAKADDPDGSATVAAYAEAFREAGIDLANLPLAEAGTRIRARPPSVALALAEALDDWAASRRWKRANAAESARLSSAARAADPDPWRNELRATLDQPSKAAALSALQALAKTAKFEELGAISLQLLGTGLNAAGDSAQAESVLRTAQQRHPRDVWINYALGKVLENLSRRDEAIRFYTAARAIRPETAHELAHALESRGDSDEAIAVFRDLTRLRPGNARHLVCLGKALKTMGRSREAGETLDAAVAASRSAIRLKPKDPFIHGNLGLALSYQGKYDEAIAEFRTAIRLEPDLAAVHIDLGLALSGQSNLDEASAELRTAIRLEAGHAGAHNNLGTVLRAQGKLDEALTEFRTAIRLQPDLVSAHNDLGVALYDQGKHEEAVTEYRTAIRLKPDVAAAHHNLGLVLEAQGKHDEAIAEFRTAIRLNPDIVQPHVDLGNILSAQGKLDEAIAQSREVIRLMPNHAEGYYNLGIALARQGKLDGAIAEYRTAIRLDPDSLGAHSNLGSVLYEKGKLDEAIAEYRTAIRLNPDSIEVHSNLGIVLNAQGKLDEAITECRTVIRLEPGRAEAHADLGTFLSGQGKLDEAVSEFRRAAELALPGSPVAREMPGRIRTLERQIALARRLPAVLRGEDKPRENAERLAFAQLAYDRKKFAIATRLWTETLDIDPKLGDGRQAQHRYNAACAATLAAIGQGEDELPLDDAAKAKLRRQALDWLRAERTAWGKLLESGPPQARPTIVKTLRHWQKDADLAGIRDAAALSRLPADERAAFAQLWADVAVLLKQAEEKQK